MPKKQKKSGDTIFSLWLEPEWRQAKVSIIAIDSLPQPVFGLGRNDPGKD